MLNLSTDLFRRTVRVTGMIHYNLSTNVSVYKDFLPHIEFVLFSFSRHHYSHCGWFSLQKGSILYVDSISHMAISRSSLICHCTQFFKHSFARPIRCSHYRWQPNTYHHCHEKDPQSLLEWKFRHVSIRIMIAKRFLINHPLIHSICLFGIQSSEKWKSHCCSSVWPEEI
jgi:hypothetical protein